MFESFLWSIISFVIFIYLFIYLPGKVIIFYFKLKELDDLAIAIGFCTTAFILFIGRFLLPTWFLLLAIMVTSIVLSYKNKISLKLGSKFKIPLIFWIVIILGVMAQSINYLLPLSRGYDQVFAAVINNHDQIWHVAIIREIMANYPPQTPGFAGLMLKNYHYFYDLTIAANLSVFKGNIYYFIQVIYPVAISALFAISCYRICQLLIISKFWQVLTIFWIFFANNLNYLYSLVNYTDWTSVPLSLYQPINLLYIHQSVLSLSLAVYLFILVQDGFKNQKHLAVAGFILASLLFIKVYTFIVLTAVFIAFGSWQLINEYRKNNHNAYIKTIIPFIIIFILVISIIYKNGFTLSKTPFFSFQPGWIINIFFSHDIDKYFPQISGLRQIYEANNNHIKLFVLNSFLAVCFFTLALNLRLIGLLAFFNKNKKPILIYLILTTFFSFSIMLMGNQKSSPFDIFQFSQTGVFALSILLGKVVDTVIHKNRNKIVCSLLISLILIPMSMISLTKAVTAKPFIYDQKIIDGLIVLHNKPKGVVLSLLESTRNNNLIQALSGKPEYLSDMQMLGVLQNNGSQRIEQIKGIEGRLCNLSENDLLLLVQNNIKYLITKANPCPTINGQKESYPLGNPPIYKSEQFWIYEKY